jgi:L-histidine N-alpha-methyltransferase
MKQRNYTILKPVDEGPENEQEKFAVDVLSGLSARDKTLPSKYFYDSRGSELFRKIMDLPEYYLTDCEMEILQTHGHEISDVVCTEGMNIVELGAGDGLKTKVILDKLSEKKVSFSYNPIDISESAIRGLSAELQEILPAVDVHGLVADYFDGICWLSERKHCGSLVLFLGSNIGNFTPGERGSFLDSLWNAMDNGDYVLIGFDLKKDINVIKQAYDDSEGITAEFNYNLLRRINRELGGDFDIEKFNFHSIWNPKEGAIESFLVSTVQQRVYIEKLAQTFEFEAWEPIHTESSYKFTRKEVDMLAARTGFEPLEYFADNRGYFMNALWRVRKGFDNACG